jgi:hypothetical protein
MKKLDRDSLSDKDEQMIKEHKLFEELKTTERHFDLF